MAQKFVSLEEAAKQLGVSKDRLTELREGGKVRAYRDGAGWKFRSDDIEKLEAEGIPPADSDISLGMDSEEPSDIDAASMSDITLESSDIEIDLDDDAAPAAAEVSDVGLEDLDEPTVPVDMPEDDETVDIGLDNELDELSDSILLSEAELGPSSDRPPSTIIGKAEMAADLDLELAASGSDLESASDTKLGASVSNVFAPHGPGDAVLDVDPSGISDTFGEIEELEIDLEAESSRILSPEDISKAKAAAASKSAAANAAEISDLELAPSDSNAPASKSGGVLDSMIGEGSPLSGLSALELDDDNDDEVLGDGSDITLSSESSGINIISPSDSGLALDEVPLELAGASAIGSSLDLGGSGEMSLEPIDLGPGSSGAGKAAEPFSLTPFGEEAGEEEEDSSQIIPLDEVSEDEAGPLLGVGEPEGLGDDFATAGLATNVMAVGEPVEEIPFSTGVVLCLAACMLLITICGVMTFDILRNMWSWDQVYSINSSLLEIVNPFLS